MKGYLKKGLCLCMATVLAFSFTGCSKQKKQGSELLEEASTISKDHVFSCEEVQIDGLPKDVTRLSCVGDRIHCTSTNYEEFLEIYSFNSDGSDFKTVKIPSSYNNYVQSVCFDKDENIYMIYVEYNYQYEDDDTDGEASEGDADDGEVGVANAGDDVEEVSEGSDEISEESTEEVSKEASEEASEDIAEEDSLDDDSEEGYSVSSNEEINYLVKYDQSGNLIYQINLSEKFGEGDDYFSVTDMNVTEDGTVVFSFEKGIYSYTQEDDFKLLVDNAGAYNYYYIHRGFNGKMFISYYGDTGYVFSSFDPATGKIGEPSTALNSSGDYSFFGGNGYDLYISDPNAFYGYDLASDTKTKILDYVDSDLQIAGSTSLAVALSDVEFLVCIPDEDYNYCLYRLKKIPPEQVKDKQIITIGGYYIDYITRRQAYAFNQKSDEYKIKFVDYSSYDEEDTYGTGADKFNMDIVSGNVPDIIIIGNEMPVDSYINKGLFQDLTPYFEKDPDISESDMVTNVFDALKTNGKIYQVVPSFRIGTMVVKTKFTEGKETLTFDDCKKLIEQTGVNKQYAFGLINREQFLEYGLKFSGKNYIDWENKACHFDSDSFIEFLEFSNSLLAEIPESAYEDYENTVFHDDESLFNVTTMNSFRDFNENTKAYFGEHVSYVGYPNELGVNSSVIYPEMRVAISAQSKNKDAAWDFIKMYYSDDYQLDLYEFPIKKSAFDEAAKKATQRPYYMDGDEKVEYDDYSYIGNDEVKLDPMTQEEVTEVVNFIKSLSLVYSNNDSVNNIIYEETSAFYSGQKSAKEVADIIQSRVSIYVNENS